MKFCTKLTDRKCIKIIGGDATQFLQNIITCDIEIPETFGALLTPQGKIIFEFYVKTEKNGYLIDVNAGMKDELVKHLGFYKLRAEVEIIEDDNINVFVLWGENENGTDPRIPQLGKRIYANNIDEEQNAELNAELEDWHKWRTSLGVPELNVDYKTKELFPHFAMMDQFKNGGVEFSKGCYVGQEVVARMQHKSNARQRFVIVEGENGLPKMNEEIISGKGKKIGVMGESYNNIGLALVYMERIYKILDKDTIMTQNGILKCSLPKYVNFELTPGETK